MVGGSVAGSTAGWWPSDRDRFPPRFLLPPSLQTHNCIISTRLPLPSHPPSRPAAPRVRPTDPLPYPPTAFCTAFLQSLPLHVPSRSFHRHGPPCLYHRALLGLLVCSFLHLLLQHTSSSTPLYLSPSSFSPFHYSLRLFQLLFIGGSVLVVVVGPNVDALITLRETSLDAPNIQARLLS